MRPAQLGVVLAFRNGARAVAEAVAAVLEQELAVELVLVDDGSADAALDVAQGLAHEHAEIVGVLHQARLGIARARDLGLRLVSAPYVCFLELDDLVAPAAFQDALALLKEDRHAVGVWPRMSLVDVHRALAPGRLAITERRGTASAICRTAAVRALGGYPREGELREALALRGKIRTLPLPPYRFHVAPGSHLDLFLQRPPVEDGQVDFGKVAPEEARGVFWAEAPSEEQAMVALLTWLMRHWPSRGGLVALGAEEERACRWLGETGRLMDCRPTIWSNSAAPDDWRQPVGLLVVDARDGADSVARRLHGWLPFVAHLGLIVFHGLDAGGAGQDVYERLLHTPGQVVELGRERGIGVLQRTA